MSICDNINETESRVEEIKARLERQNATSAEYRRKVKLTLSAWMGAVVCALASGITAFIVLLTTFTKSSGLAAFGALAGVAFIALGLILNGYTKRESNALCALKRRPLGYLMRASSKAGELVLFGVFALLCGTVSIASLVLFFTVDAAGAMTMVLAILLLLALASSIVSYVLLLRTQKFIVSNSSVFEEIEYDFAKKTFLI